MLTRAATPARLNSGQTLSALVLPLHFRRRRIARVCPAALKLQLKCYTRKRNQRITARQLNVCAVLSTSAAGQSLQGQQLTLGQVCAVITGYAVLVGSLFRSVPQIVRCVKNRSVAGLSLMSVSAEMVAYLNTVSYNFVQGYAFNTYGDIASCLVQDAVLVGLIFHFGRVGWVLRVALTMAVGGWGWWLMSGSCGLALLTALQLGTIFILSVFGRIPQIILNMRNGNSGELSSLTCLLNVLGSGARVFTTLQLTGDKVILWGTYVQLLLNSILLYQTVETARQAGKLVVTNGGAVMDGPTEGMAVKTA